MKRIIKSFIICALIALASFSHAEEQYATVEGQKPIRAIDGKTVIDLFGGKKVSPGKHTVTIFMGCLDSACRDASLRNYVFTARAGLLYRVMADKIVVLDPNDKYNRKVDELKPAPGTNEYLGREEMATAQAAYARAQAEKDAIKRAEQESLMVERKRNLSLVRKIGARVCLSTGRVDFVGYVEGLAEHKIQIRVSEASYINARLIRVAGFSPHIIWDDPLRWELCES